VATQAKQTAKHGQRRRKPVCRVATQAKHGQCGSASPCWQHVTQAKLTAMACSLKDSVALSWVTKGSNLRSNSTYILLRDCHDDDYNPTEPNFCENTVQPGAWGTTDHC
jgi:hypothetical protein